MYIEKQLKNNYYNITISIDKMVSLFVFSRNKQKSAQFKALFNNIKHSDYNFTISRNYKYADFLVSFTRNDINYFINKHRTLNINYVLYSFLDEKNTEPKYYEYRGKKVYIFNTNTDNFNSMSFKTSLI